MSTGPAALADLCGSILCALCCILGTILFCLRIGGCSDVGVRAIQGGYYM
jgi:hypothetical protein